jgi:hypothetical protein
VTKTSFRQFPSGCLYPPCLHAGNPLGFRQQQGADGSPAGNGLQQRMNSALPHKPRQPAFILELRAIPGPWLAPPEQRLKGLLKAALRAFGFRCEVCRPAGTVEPARRPEAAKLPHT